VPRSPKPPCKFEDRFARYRQRRGGRFKDLALEQHGRCERVGFVLKEVAKSGRGKIVTRDAVPGQKLVPALVKGSFPLRTRGRRSRVHADAAAVFPSAD